MSRGISLTPREEEVAKLLVTEPTYHAIALALGCAPATVKAHVQRIAAKLPPDMLPSKRRVVQWLNAQGRTL